MVPPATGLSESASPSREGLVILLAGARGAFLRVNQTSKGEEERVGHTGECLIANDELSIGVGGDARPT